MNNIDWVQDAWKSVASERTPFYLLSEAILKKQFNDLPKMMAGKPCHHWLSLKTQPLACVVDICRHFVSGIECVSECELRAALAQGVAPENILVNGVAKHRWLEDFRSFRLNVVLDSITEIQHLLRSPTRWRLGVRINTPWERNPDCLERGTQFGLTLAELKAGIKLIAQRNKTVDIIHFHLGSNVRDVADFVHAIEFVDGIAKETSLNACVLDCGGGIPAFGERLDMPERSGNPTIVDLYQRLEENAEKLSSFSELWFENGRLPLSGSGVLVVSVCDVKERDDSRYLICDGGRTNRALVSDWERHEITVMPTRKGQKVLTAVCGNTCMAYDMLVRINLSKEIRIGDRIIWHNAGAYHIPWETRFSYGLSRVLLLGSDGLVREVREAESPDDWWRSIGGRSNCHGMDKAAHR